MKPLFIGDHEVVEGDVLEADDSFDCMKAGGHYTVRKDADDLSNELYVICEIGDHSLESQRGERDQLVGFRLVEDD